LLLLFPLPLHLDLEPASNSGMISYFIIHYPLPLHVKSYNFYTRLLCNVQCLIY
jgi:hypothetical protein